MEIIIIQSKAERAAQSKVGKTNTNEMIQPYVPELKKKCNLSNDIYDYHFVSQGKTKVSNFTRPGKTKVSYFTRQDKRRVGGRNYLRHKHFTK